MATPLTRAGSNGIVVTRPATVEKELEAALLETTNSLRERGAIASRGTTSYLTNEALLHLVRDAHRRGNALRVYALLPLWLKRCKIYLSHERPDVAQAIMDELTSWLASDNNRLDFFEVRFKQAMRFVRANARRVVRTRARESSHVSVREEEQFDVEDPATSTASIAMIERAGAAREAIDELPEPYRKTATLVWVMELTQAAAAERLGVTVRTVHNHLKEARACIEKLLEKP